MWGIKCLVCLLVSQSVGLFAYECLSVYLCVYPLVLKIFCLTFLIVSVSFLSLFQCVSLCLHLSVSLSSLFLFLPPSFPHLSVCPFLPPSCPNIQREYNNESGLCLYRPSISASLKLYTLLFQGSSVLFRGVFRDIYYILYSAFRVSRVWVCVCLCLCVCGYIVFFWVYCVLFTVVRTVHLYIKYYINIKW